MRAAIIINPISGRQGTRGHGGSDRESFARAWLKARDLDADVELTKGQGHAIELARGFVSRGFDRIIAWGGDGTANEVGGALLGSSTVMGLVRSGSGDGLARNLLLPRDPRAGLAVAMEGPPRTIDAGWIGTRHFLNAAGIGFDASVARAFNRRRVRGGQGYVVAGLSGLWSYRAPHYQLDLEGVMSAGPFFLIAFANGREYGNGFILAADADLGDGFLDAVAVGSGSRLSQLWRARRLAVGVARPAKGIHRARIKAATISGPILLCHVDGETFETSGSLVVRVDPGALRIATPELPR